MSRNAVRGQKSPSKRANGRKSNRFYKSAFKYKSKNKNFSYNTFVPKTYIELNEDLEVKIHYENHGYKKNRKYKYLYI